MSDLVVYPLDLGFQGFPNAIAAFLIPHPEGGILIECGPGSTVDNLQRQLQMHGFAPEQITDLFVTHIHLDHAGAAGWLARQGARVHAHYKGVPHLIDPAKLLSSARRIYQDQMDLLWGEFLPVPQDRCDPLFDDDEIQIDGVRVVAYDTPGHASHHMVYRVGDVCFTGDIGGVRLPGPRQIRLPMPPPEFHLETWRKSARRLQDLDVKRVAPTHFGIYLDPVWHFDELVNELNAVEAWIEESVSQEVPVETLREQITAWADARSKEKGLPPDLRELYEIANPAWMSADGIVRYWRKFRNGNPPEGSNPQ